MENLITSARVVLPLLLMMAIGKLASRGGIMTPELIRGINKTLFYIFLPATVFRQIYSLDISKDLDMGLIAFSFVVVFVIAILSILIVPRLEKNPARAGSIAQALFRGNFVLFGLALSEAVYGQKALAMTTLIVSVTNPLGNALGTACFDLVRAGDVKWRDTLRKVLTTPTIIASLTALLFVFTGIHLPDMIVDVTQQIGRVSTPLALIALGGSISLSGFLKDKKTIMLVTFLKMFLLPAIVLTLAALLGFRNERLVAVFAMISVPVASSSFPVASAMGGDADLAAQLLISTAVTTILSVFVIVFTLKSLTLI